MNPSAHHLDWNDLAVLAERGPDAADPAALAHLAGCGTCLAAYADAVRCRDEQLAGRPAAGPTAAAPRPRRAAARGGLAWGAGALAAAAVLLLVLLPTPPDPGDGNDPRASLQRRLQSLSTAGPLLPGVQRLADAEPTRYRAGGTATAGIDALLEPFAQRFGADPADSDAAYWLGAAYLASGRLSYADDVLRRALQRHPGAAGLRHLDAVTAYRLNELDRAEAVLRGLLADRPTDGTARFNLALIEYETRRVEAARTALRALADGDRNPAVRERARALLATIGE